MDMIKAEHQTEEPENDNPDRCDVCKGRLTANQSCETENQSTHLTTRRNPSRSAKRNVVYCENDFETPSKEDDSLLLYNINQYCWKCSEVKTETLKMEDQAVPSTASHLQSDIFGKYLPEWSCKCDICDIRFSKSSKLKLHMITVHDEVKPFVCPHCPYKARLKGNLQSHILTHSGEKNFKCNICEKTFAQKLYLYIHIKGVHDTIKAFECPHCPFKTKRGNALENHILTHTGEKNFQCEICDKKFFRMASLRLHIRSLHDKVRAFECPHCPYKAARSGTLKGHILTHTGEKDFNCDICNKKFSESHRLKRHIRAVHDRIKGFECPHCPFRASRSDGLQSHILTHTGEKNFKCKICDKKFTAKGSLTLHIRVVHEKVRAFPCPHCPYKAQRNISLKAHLLTHTVPEKNFKCEICEKTFSRHTSIIAHIKTVHDKIKPFPCPHCPYEATSTTYLKRHILTHTGEKNFMCEICDKKFAESSSLKLHIRTVHDKIKPFSCPHCPYKAGDSSTLKRHILTHTREKNFKCDICDKKFSQRGNLKHHIRTVHDKELNDTDKMSDTF